MTMDGNRGLLWGAALVIGACGTIGVWKVSQEPKLDARVVALARKVEMAKQVRSQPLPPPIPPSGLDRWTTTIQTKSPARDEAVPLPNLKFGYVEIKREIQVVRVLPMPIYSVKADLDGASLTWTLQDPKPDPDPFLKVQRGEVTAIVIQRRTPGMEFAELVRLAPDVRSYLDVGEPLQTYFYQVWLEGKQTDRLDGFKEKLTTVGPDLAVEAGIPSRHRVRLLGGDKSLAILRVETYYPRGKSWESRTVQAAPGAAVPGTRWTVDALKFDKSTLVAEVTDDAGAKRELTTKP